MCMYIENELLLENKLLLLRRYGNNGRGNRDITRIT